MATTASIDGGGLLVQMAGGYSGWCIYAMATTVSSKGEDQRGAHHGNRNAEMTTMEMTISAANGQWRQPGIRGAAATERGRAVVTSVRRLCWHGAWRRWLTEAVVVVALGQGSARASRGTRGGDR
ncbi:hypothetical protein E2562_033364, partial [Oryza meyeriana var. granulata]